MPMPLSRLTQQNKKAMKSFLILQSVMLAIFSFAVGAVCWLAARFLPNPFLLSWTKGAITSPIATKALSIVDGVKAWMYKQYALLRIDSCSPAY